LTLRRGSTYGHGCTRFPMPRPGGWFPILGLWVPAGELEEFSAHRRADPGCVRVSLNQRAA